MKNTISRKITSTTRTSVITGFCIKARWKSLPYPQLNVHSQIKLKSISFIQIEWLYQFHLYFWLQYFFITILTDLWIPSNSTKNSKCTIPLIQKQQPRRRLLPRVLQAPLSQHCPHLPDERTHLRKKSAHYAPEKIRSNTLSIQDEEFNSQSQRMNDKSKRMRRNADEIQRYYKCSVKVCGKSYGSEGSLNQHYKLKHPEIYMSLPNVQSNLLQLKEESD